jgi:RNA polymerase sigma-70 factor (ECF subfamily)
VTDASPFPDPYRRLLAPVRAKCRRLLRDPVAAEDVMQEALLRCWRSGPPFHGPDDAAVVMAWLYRTCFRLAVDHLRHRRRSPLAPAAEEPTLPCAVDTALALEARSALERIAGDAPDDELEAAVLCRVDGLTQPEAAGVMGISERSVRRLLDRFDCRLAPLREESAP